MALTKQKKTPLSRSPSQQGKADSEGEEGKFYVWTKSEVMSILGEEEGFVKIVADKKYDEVLGVHMIGANVTDLISEASAAMLLEALMSMDRDELRRDTPDFKFHLWIDPLELAGVHGMGDAHHRLRLCVRGRRDHL